MDRLRLQGLSPVARDRRHPGGAQAGAAGDARAQPVVAHRARTRSEELHDRHIITQAPKEMWATDATQIATVQDGKVWLFGAIEHWNAELVGWHVAKRGTRFEATQGVAIAVRQQFGPISPGVARGLAPRHDHGSNFMADHFQTKIRSWGIAPSFGFVAEPQTTGVIERFFRTFEEQVARPHLPDHR